MRRTVLREMTDLIDMQDKAIAALQQALLATQLALKLLSDHRNELGHQQMFPLGGGITAYPPTTVPYTITIPTAPNQQIWNGSNGIYNNSDNSVWSLSEKFSQFQQAKADAEAQQNAEQWKAQQNWQMYQNYAGALN